MKASISVSSVLHIAIIAWGITSISSQKSFEAAEVEAFPVDIVPIEALTQSIKGAPEADLSEIPAPVPTTAPPVEEQAQNPGETETDTPANTAEETPKPPVEIAALPEPVAEPQVEIVPEPPVPAEVAEEPKPSEPLPIEPAIVPEPEIIPVTETTEITEETQVFASLPELVPAPQVRPDPETDDSLEDDIKALLNKQEQSAGGSKRSDKQASLGSKKSNSEVKLSQSEMDALRAQIEQCWVIMAGMEEIAEMRVTVRMRLDKDGAIAGRPTVSSSGGPPDARRAFEGGAKRAVMRCAPYNLPLDKYDAWQDVVVNFDPSAMFQ